MVLRPLSVVRRFAIYMQSIDPTTEVPPTHILVQKKGRATPFLYSQADLTALIIVTKALQSADRGLTLRTLILLLSVTGMRIGEAIRLDIDDFDPINGILTVRNTKFGKTRELPLHQTTVTALSSYLQRDGQPKRSSGTRALFLSTVGTRLDYNCMQQTFRRLVERAGLKRKSASCRPRLHDLRHTFAVETILDGYRDGNEPGNRIALLSTYLDHVIRRLHIGICPPHRSCWPWSASDWNVLWEVQHDCARSHASGILHRKADPATPS